MDILHSSMADLQKSMDEGELSSQELVEFYLDRIARLDKNIGAVSEVAGDAVQIAEVLDEERKNGQIRGILHGLPILVKDNIDTGGGLHTTGGTLALSEHRTASDAAVVKSLRNAGAVILGKTNLSELANFVSTTLPDGFSAGGGQVKNPFGAYEIGGSSSGSAAAAACGFAAASIGTETSGSIVMPSSMCGVVGFKPAVGALSGEGIIPLAPTQDTAGPIGKTVEDVQKLYEVMAGLTFSRENPGKESSRLRLGLLEEPYRDMLDDESKEAFRHTVAVLDRCGIELVPIGSEYFSENDNLIDDPTIMLYEFRAGINRYLANSIPPCPVHSLKELIEFNEAHRETAIPYGQDILIESEKTSGDLTDRSYLAALEQSIRVARVENIDAAIGRYKLDAIMAPSFLACDYPARAGYPSLAVPVGFSKKSGPVSVLLFGKNSCETILFEIGKTIEQNCPRSELPPLSF